ncbi:hypothetical protein HY486_01075 [Candidatus Woesearchaeota archaeon]|nr:hypothetical protein [Candidatus Woesearchaeota archaeon]
MDKLIESFAKVGPIYNLFLVVIVIILFIKLFRAQAINDVYLTPWKLVFTGLCIFILETIITIARNVLTKGVPGRHINGYFELAIVILFLYALLLQHEHMKSQQSI